MLQSLDREMKMEHGLMKLVHQIIVLKIMNLNLLNQNLLKVSMIPELDLT